jgi:hypothetical protein
MTVAQGLLRMDAYRPRERPAGASSIGGPSSVNGLGRRFHRRNFVDQHGRRIDAGACRLIGRAANVDFSTVSLEAKTSRFVHHFKWAVMHAPKSATPTVWRLGSGRFRIARRRRRARGALCIGRDGAQKYQSTCE